MINEQTGLVYDCNPNSPIPCQYPTGEAALRLFGMDGGEGEKWLCVLWLCLFLVGFVGGAALAMTYVDLVPQDREEEPDFEQDDQVAAKEIKRTASASAITLGDATRVELITSDSNSSTTTTARALDQSSADAAANADSAHAKHSSGGFISWNNLSYSVSVGGTEKERTLLHDMFGYAKPGMMVALMGASGSGESTPPCCAAPRAASQSSNRLCSCQRLTRSRRCLWLIIGSLGCVPSHRLCPGKTTLLDVLAG